MKRSLLICGLMAIKVTGSLDTKKDDLNGNDEGCNGEVDRVPCCEEGFIVGDNKGQKETFIQTHQFISNCTHTCKAKYPNCVGVTESITQQYKSGPGKNKNKCWCEFDKAQINTRNQAYRTCMFKLSSPANAPITAKAYKPPEYLMVVLSGDAASNQSQKIGRYTLQNQSHNNFPVWKKEHIFPEEILFLSDREHWVIGPNVNVSLFGILSKDRPAPLLPHLVQVWMFWDGHQWKEDNSIQVLAGENKDVGKDREIIMLDFMNAEIENVTDPSLCCGLCKDRRYLENLDRKDQVRALRTALFNYDENKKQCACFNTPYYGTCLNDWQPAWNPTLPYQRCGKNTRPKHILLTRSKSQITSGLCDADSNWSLEIARRSGMWEQNPAYNYSDVQGPLGVDRDFVRDNLNLHSVDKWIDKSKTQVDRNSCCRECRKENPNINIFVYREYEGEESNYGICKCYTVRPGNRPVTVSSKGKYAGICDTDSGFKLPSSSGILNQEAVFNYSDVLGALGMDRVFYTDNLQNNVIIELDETNSMDQNNPSACCEECRKKNPNIQIYQYGDEYGVGTYGYGMCKCYSVQRGTRPVTRESEENYTFAAICSDKYAASRPRNCGEATIRSSSECGQAAASLGYGAEVIQTGSWSDRPPGCMVAYAKWTYFNENATGHSDNRLLASICHKNIA